MLARAMFKTVESVPKMFNESEKTIRFIINEPLNFLASVNVAGESDVCCMSVGVEGFTTQEDQEMISRIEKQLKRRFAIGSQVSEHSIIQDFTKQVR